MGNTNIWSGYASSLVLWNDALPVNRWNSTCMKWETSARQIRAYCRPLVSIHWLHWLHHIKCYNPSEDLTFDEHLFSCQACCSFTQFMAQKQDKFGWPSYKVSVQRNPLFGKESWSKARRSDACFSCREEASEAIYKLRTHHYRIQLFSS
jgi:hypothetical protein